MTSNGTLIILSPGFPESEADSTCLPLQQSLVRTISELYAGIKIIVLAFQYPYHKNVYSWHGIKVIPFDGRNRGGLTRIRLRQQIRTTLRKICREEKITGLLSFWSNECARIGKKFGDAQGIKHYCWVLGQDARKQNKYPGQLHFKTDELIALSDFIQDEFEKNHGVRPKYVIPPGVEERLFPHGQLRKDIDVLGVGSLIQLKQYDIFLEVLSELKDHLPSIKAVLVGKGPEKQNLEILIKRLKLERNITLAGELPYQQVLDLMERTKVFIHPSSYEGFGCVCIEALHGGAQVISFCKPMKTDVNHWHIAKDKKEMIEISLKILESRPAAFKPITQFAIADTANAIMKLFHED